MNYSSSEFPGASVQVESGRKAAGGIGDEAASSFAARGMESASRYRYFRPPQASSVH